LTAIQNEKMLRDRSASEIEARLEDIFLIRPAPTSLAATPSRPPSSEIDQPAYPTLFGFENPSLANEIMSELSAENFSPDLISRGIVLFQIKDKAEMKVAVRTFAGHVSRGVPEQLFIDVYNSLNKDISLVPKFLDSFRKLSEIGFPETKIKEALMHCKCDYETAAQYLVEFS